MSGHIAEERLNDYVDGLLEALARADVEAHLAACPACRDEVERQQSLLARLHALPTSTDPPAMVRAGTLRAIRSTAASARHPRRQALRALAWPLAAAALALILATAVITHWLMRAAAAPTVASAPATAPRPPAAVGPEATAAKGAAPSDSSAVAERPETTRAQAPPAPSPLGARLEPGRPAVLPAAFRRDQRRFEQQIAQLQQELAEKQDQLSPATVAILRRNLRVIDRAIAESRQALEQDPGDGTLGRLMLSAYEQKVELLRRATSFAS